MKILRPLRPLLPVLTLAFVLPAEATVFVRLADEDLTDQAPVIAEVRVLAIDPAAGGERARTEVQARVDRVITGPIAESRLTIDLPGGILPDGSRVKMFGAPRFEVGQRALVFLSPGKGGRYVVLHLLQGVFHVVDFEGRDVAFREFAGAREVTSKDLPARPPEMPRDLDRFRGWLTDRAAGVERPADYFVEVPERAAGEKFTLIRSSQGMPARWRNFDFGNTVQWRANQAGQPGLAGGGFAEFQAAINAWNADPGSNIELRYAGTTGVSTDFNTADDLNVLLFDDPNDDIDSDFGCNSGGTIATTQIRFGGATPHVHNGTSFLQMREADMVTNKGIQCWIPSNNRAAEVFAHELGHGLAIGHSCGDDDAGPCDTPVKNEALMRAQAHGDGRGPSLRDDDRAAAAFLHGVPAPAGPANLTASVLAPDRIRLNWTDRSTDETSFEIQRRVGSGSFVALATVGANTRQFDDTSVVTGVTYGYRVRARNGGGVSDFSNTASATTAGEPAPTGLTATAVSATQITLAWRDNAGGESAYEVQGAVDGGSFALLQTLPADSETATLGGLATGTIYRFRVRATGGDGTSPYSNQALATTFCVAGESSLCLNGGRFKVEVDWRNFVDENGIGSVVPGGSDDSGLLWFFASDNWEMLIKVLDGCAFNDRFWVFAAATTNVEYTMTVTDTAASIAKTYTNTLGTASPAITDTDAFATCSAGGNVTAGARKARTASPAAALDVPSAGSEIVGSTTGKGTPCVAGDNTLCLNTGRFRVEVDWRNFVGETGPASVVPLGSDDSGLLWFFDAANWEMLIKVLDGCAFNGHFWVFSAATTDVQYTLTVTDTETGTVRTYDNPLGTASPAITDTEAFPTCP